MKSYSAMLLSSLLIAMLACNSTSNDSDATPQTIVTTDSSDASGRLYVYCFNAAGTSVHSNAYVKLFLSYDDLQRDLPLNTIITNSQGKADFGFVLKGNYYLTGMLNTGLLKDTSVAQILPQKTITRNLYLK